jgi:PAS domain S-box-containing protein
MNRSAEQQKIFVVDDDRGLLRLIEKTLQREGLLTATAASGAEALEWLGVNRADLLLLDLKLQDTEGKELIRRLSEIHRELPFIIITGQGDERVAVEMMKCGARDYLVKDAQFLQFVPEVVKNVLEQIEIERRLAAAEEQVRLVQSVVEKGFSAVLIASADLPDPKILYVNPSFAQLTGHAPERIVGRPLSALPELAAVCDVLREGLPSQERFWEDASKYQSAEGERWAEWRVGPVKDKSGLITHWLVILRDITERKRLEKEILEITDREQRRIGQDLHDGLCQHLAGIELMSQVLERKLAARSKNAATRVSEIAGHVREAISQTRLLARGMSPVMLDDEGLMTALQELASNTEKMFHIQCEFKCDPPVLVPDPAVATHLFRIAQEAVSNAIKHGKAKRVVLELKSLGGGKIEISASDDGCGFPPRPAEKKGMGLHIMRSRASMIGGSLITENRPGGGARVICSVALNSATKQNTFNRGGKKQNLQKKQGSHR